MFIDWIPDELFLKIRNELQKDERTIDLTGIKISEIPNDIVSRRDMALRMWGNRHAFGDNEWLSGLIGGDYPAVSTVSAGDIMINPINNDSRSVNFSNDMIERIKRLIGNQQNQTISSRPDVNYNIDYLDDLP
jgi:hypothetical protein